MWVGGNAVYSSVRWDNVMYSSVGWGIAMYSSVGWGIVMYSSVGWGNAVHLADHNRCSHQAVIWPKSLYYA